MNVPSIQSIVSSSHTIMLMNRALHSLIQSFIHSLTQSFGHSFIQNLTWMGLLLDTEMDRIH